MKRHVNLEPGGDCHPLPSDRYYAISMDIFVRKGVAMENGIHFISGLPRSGSTLLAAILRQNPRFHAAMTSPVCGMYMALEGAMSRRNEAAVFIGDTQRRN